MIITIDFLDRTLFQNTFQIFHCLLLFIKTIYFKEIEIIQIDSIAIMLIQFLGICSAILFPILYVAINKGVLCPNTLSNVVGGILPGYQLVHIK